MPYVTSGERMARQEGERTGLLTAIADSLEAKFGEAGLAFSQELLAISDTNKLRLISKAIVNAPTIDALRALVQ
jgi:hypothetical protein